MNDLNTRIIRFTNSFRRRFFDIFNEPCTEEIEERLYELMEKYPFHRSFSDKHGWSLYFTFFLYKTLITVVVDEEDMVATTVIIETHMRDKYKNRV